MVLWWIANVLLLVAVVPVLVALLLGAGALGAILLAGRGSDKTATEPGPKTIVKTVTSQGTTVHQTVTAQPPSTATTAPAPSGASGAALNDAGYTKLRAGDAAGALPLFEQAVAKLNGTGSTTEAYADYNLAYTRYSLGDCTDVLTLLDRSQSIQGHRKEIDRLRKSAEKRC